MKTRRHAKILELIKEYDIDTQDELLRYLRENGFDVTQATVSRDIKELRLVKTFPVLESTAILPAVILSAICPLNSTLSSPIPCSQ